MAALAVTETLNHYLPADAEKFKIKWINDVHHSDRKISGALCTCHNIGNASFLSIGVGVNLNSSPVPGVSVHLHEIARLKEPINVDQFVRLLSSNLMTHFTQADLHGFEGELYEAVNSKLDFLGKKVKIFDETLTKVIITGVFKGINRFGHAKIL